MLVELKKASRSFSNFGREKVLFSNADLSLKAGEIVAVTGASGNGKSTLLNILAGFETLDEGSYFYQKEDVTNNRRRIGELRRTDMSIIPQGLLLIEQLTAFENIEVATEAKKINISRETVEEYARELEIEPLLDIKVKKLSLGERQRIAIVRALVCSGNLVLADEPTSALNHDLALKAIELFRRRADSGTAFLMITHDLSLLDAADTVYSLDGGRLEKTKKQQIS